jgi:hypothetical protein
MRPLPHARYRWAFHPTEREQNSQRFPALRRLALVSDIIMLENTMRYATIFLTTFLLLAMSASKIAPRQRARVGAKRSRCSASS